MQIEAPQSLSGNMDVLGTSDCELGRHVSARIELRPLECLPFLPDLLLIGFEDLPLARSGAGLEGLPDLEQAADDMSTNVDRVAV
ncbi:hypothetical protein ELI17_37350 [Rhizobium ruizarguesonis]|uniref:hypothetical protein n=1 Tax=Rhizobium ruizarguesonis TaxID=2081791 RepID=UPI001031B2FC|nr:hypothetical protein [Rhizobium ruizarguesonis]TAW39040.1 hypothetical protein ELI17_37350 [Rhizobium ruizarguesonis]